jgi:hypothetical protein
MRILSFFILTLLSFITATTIQESYAASQITLVRKVPIKKGTILTKNKKIKGAYSLYTPIKGKGRATPLQLFKFIAKHNRFIDKNVLSYIAKVYVRECRIENINHDIAFAQMALETNFLKYGNTAKPYQNNFAGIGVVNNNVKGSHFSTILIGIRAHIQHLSGYTHKEKLKTKVVDPRFILVKRGVAPLIKDLSGKWAMDKYYANKILKLTNLLVITKA